MNEKSIIHQQNLFEKAYSEFGYSNKSLYSAKGKQHIRFYNLLNQFELKDTSILDVGCGFGDLNDFLTRLGVDSYEYLGVDITSSFISEAKKRWESSPQRKISFLNGEFLKMEMLDCKFDFVVGSEIFNLKLEDEDNYENVELFIKKAIEISKVAVAFNFKSDRVDEFTSELSFYNSPTKILDIAYGISKRVVLKNDYMPFEFTVIIYKQDAFDKKSTMFNDYYKCNEKILENLELEICKK